MTIPFGIFVVFFLAVLFILFLLIEQLRHRNVLDQIPVRIWVNGTRGKSSVTRLIAAGLRSKNIKVIAKTTGTKARFIYDNKTEEPIERISQPNIHEQISILRKATKENPEITVLECMALRPDLQYTEANQIVKPSIVVITNVRADHIDVMGPTIKDIAHNFINALPKGIHLITTEKKIFSDFHKILEKRNIKITIVDAEVVNDHTMEEFHYIEHKENVALALKVCDMVGVDREKAIYSMQNSLPDPGALRKYHLKLNNKNVYLINAMAANDPDSTYMIWNALKADTNKLYVLINCRADRIDRSFQIAKLIKESIQTADQYFLTGKGTEVLRRNLSKSIGGKKIIDIGNLDPAIAVQKIAGIVPENSMIFAIGNTVGYGEALINEFLIRSQDAIG